MPHCIRYVELDVPPVLAEKRRLLALADCQLDVCEQVTIDLLHQPVDTVLAQHGTLDQSLPTLVWWEGGTMYFSRCSDILRSITPLLRHRDSRLWFDYVTADLARHTLPRAAAFIEAMQKMGEPFVHTFGDVAAEIAAVGLEVVEDIDSSLSQDNAGEIFRLYRFCVARCHAHVP